VLENQSFLVTGATGRLGCDLVTRLEDLGATVLPLVLEGYPVRPKRVAWKARSEPLIARSPSALHRLPDPDYVINLHWSVHRDLPYSHQLLYEVDYNMHRPGFLWDWLADKPLRRFVNISSIRIFSRFNESPVSFESEPHPVSPYGIAKLAAEKFFPAYFIESRFPVVHLRLCSVASFGEHPSQLMSQLYASAFDNKKIALRVKPSNIVYIDEAVDLMINAALTATESRYLVAAPARSNSDIASRFEAVSGRRLNADYQDSPRGEDLSFVSDVPKLAAEWIRQTPLDDMIGKIIRLHGAGWVR
jgi:nucleoside-diphosphate-sugar epimerase